MPPPLGCPTRTLATSIQATNENILSSKPPLPTSIARIAHGKNDAAVVVPPLVAGALVAAFARAVAEGLGNELLTHYYLTTGEGQKTQVNVDRVLDRLLAEFTRGLWDELYDFYTASDRGFTRQVSLLFDGPIRQLVLVLNGPETSACILEHLGPGLSRRKSTWSKDATGIELRVALQLVCGYWHREYPSLSPGGSPEEISRALCNRLVDGRASNALINNIRKMLLSPHYLQLHILETAIWDRMLRRRRPPPRDGFHVAQFRFECQLAINPGEYSSPGEIDLAARRAITGTSAECRPTTVSQYTDRHWQRSGRLVLSCLNSAVKTAYQSAEQGDGFSGMSFWDGNGDGDPSDFCPGLRLLHFEVEDGLVQLNVCAWAHCLVDIFQQMAWTCAALGATPFGSWPVESGVEITEGRYEEDTMYFNCSMAHQPVSEGEGAAWLRGVPSAVIARGFPVDLTEDIP
ncbi:hypothetical protein LIA77_09126 [Sarocladium implicatum]|nr:hypothetical protein LIA77_09126 [Sarocladium implicatum]